MGARAGTAPSDPDGTVRAMATAPGDRIDVLDQGFVRLDAALADDLSVANAARVSFGIRKEALDESDRGLIGFLMRERHGSPFEHNAFRFHVRCPIFVAREWFRHRVGSYNELSARYKELDGAFYLPAPEDVRTQVGKPGAYTFETVEAERAERTRERLREAYEAAYATYQALLADGIAKEVARAVLPVGIYTEFFWTLNARSLMNFLSLRNSANAQREIRRYAEALERFFADAMPVTYAAFVANDRPAVTRLRVMGCGYSAPHLPERCFRVVMPVVPRRRPYPTASTCARSVQNDSGRSRSEPLWCSDLGFSGGADGTRTHDPLLAKQVL